MTTTSYPANFGHKKPIIDPDDAVLLLIYHGPGAGLQLETLGGRSRALSMTGGCPWTTTTSRTRSGRLPWAGIILMTVPLVKGVHQKIANRAVTASRPFDAA